jgi:hypothetical protein
MLKAITEFANLTGKTIKNMIMDTDSRLIIAFTDETYIVFQVHESDYGDDNDSYIIVLGEPWHEMLSHRAARYGLITEAEAIELTQQYTAKIAQEHKERELAQLAYLKRRYEKA